MKAILPLLMIVAVLTVSGCLAVSPEAIIATSPVVQDFLADHPNAEIKATFYSEQEAADILDDIKEDCEKDTVVAKDYYKVSITDAESGLSVTAWVDWDRQLVECVVKKGTEGEKPEGNVTEPECTHHHSLKCHDGYLYWHNSCGNKEEQYKYCEYGCEGARCLEAPVVDIDSHCDETSYGVLCVLETSKTMTYMDDIEITIIGVTDSDAVIVINGENYDVHEGSEIDDYGPLIKIMEIRTFKYPVETGSVEFKIIEEVCTSHHTYKCYNDHVYWYNSCGNKEEKKHYCEHGCEDGACIEEVCESQHSTACYDGDVYWYDSCGVKESKNEDCLHGCEDGACVIPAAPESVCDSLNTEFFHYSCKIYDGDPVTLGVGGDDITFSFESYTESTGEMVLAIGEEETATDNKNDADKTEFNIGSLWLRINDAGYENDYGYLVVEFAENGGLLGILPPVSYCTKDGHEANCRLYLGGSLVYESEYSEYLLNASWKIGNSEFMLYVDGEEQEIDTDEFPHDFALLKDSYLIFWEFHEEGGQGEYTYIEFDSMDSYCEGSSPETCVIHAGTGAETNGHDLQLVGINPEFDGIVIKVDGLVEEMDLDSYNNLVVDGMNITLVDIVSFIYPVKYHYAELEIWYI